MDDDEIERSRGRATARLGAGITVEWVAETGSTNADLAARPPVGDGWVVRTADVQTAGRGRLGRRWEAPPGSGLLMSMRFRPDLPEETLPLCTLATALAAVEAVRALGASSVGLRWPNDLVVGEGEDPPKLAGVLAEAVAVDSGVEVVVGIGINVDLPEGFAPPGAHPVDLRSVLGSVPDRADLLADVVEGTRRRVRALATRPAEVVEEARASCVTLGRDVRATTPAGEVAGRAIGLDASGRLEVVTDDGVVVVGAGDIHG